MSSNAERSVAKYAVIFDVDGVLVASYRPHLLSWQQMSARHGLTMTEEQFAATFGKTTREIIRQLWPGRFDEGAVAALDGEKEALYREILERDFPEMPGAADLIGQLHAAGFALAIGSSGPPENVRLVARKIGNGKFISAAVDGMEVRHGKPEPDIFLAAAKKLGVEPGRCAVIEDAPVGLDAARRAGMAAIALMGTAPREALAVHGQIIVERLSELNAGRIGALIDGMGR